MHLRFAFELGNTLKKYLAVEADSAAQSFVSIKHRSKTEWQHSSALKAFTHHMCMLEQSFLSKITGGNIFAYQNGKIPTGIRENLCVCNTFKTFYGNGTTSANTTLDCLLLNDAVCVPCHEGASPVGKTIMGRREIVKSFGEVLLAKSFLSSASGFSSA